MKTHNKKHSFLNMALCAVIALGPMMNDLQASQGKIICHTQRFQKVFSLNNGVVTFYSPGEFETEKELENRNSRVMASVPSHSKNPTGGFFKTVQYENHRHKISITNLNQFSDMDDVISIRSPKGHEVTYPLTCFKN
jgi:hypothetical protein